jgi:hypothetical protein
MARMATAFLLLSAFLGSHMASHAQTAAEAAVTHPAPAVSQSAPASVPPAVSSLQTAPASLQTAPAAMPPAIPEASTPASTPGASTPAATVVPSSADSVAAPPAITARNAGLSYDDYLHLMNVLFPVDHAVPPGLEYTMVLRFEPHLHPESQLVVRKFHSGRVDAVLYRVKVGTLWRDALQLRAANPDASLSEIAAAIPALKTQVPVTPQLVAEWHKQLFPTLARSFDRVKREDKRVQRTGRWDTMSGGTRYEVWYIEGNDEVHTIGWDNEVDSVGTGNFALAKWANPIRLYADGHGADFHGYDSGVEQAAQTPVLVKSVSYSQTETLPSAQDVAAAQAMANAIPQGALTNSAASVKAARARAGNSFQPALAGSTLTARNTPPPLPRPEKLKHAKKSRLGDLPAPGAFGAPEAAPDTPPVGNWSSATSVVPSH